MQLSSMRDHLDRIIEQGTTPSYRLQAGKANSVVDLGTSRAFETGEKRLLKNIIYRLQEQSSLQMKYSKKKKFLTLKGCNLPGGY